jgi:hypothetical protein
MHDGAARRAGIAASVLASAWGLSGTLISSSRADVQAQLPAPAAPPQMHTMHASGIEQRIALLTAELGLDAQQQSEVRKVLLDQRTQVLKVWNDESIPAGYRVIATRAISDKTAERIRALLSEEQKAKYIAPRKAHEPQPGDSKVSIEQWMGKANP